MEDEFNDRLDEKQDEIDEFNDKLDEKQDEIDTLKEINEDLIQQLVVTQEAVDFLLMGGM